MFDKDYVYGGMVERSLIFLGRGRTSSVYSFYFDDFFLRGSLQDGISL